MFETESPSGADQAGNNSLKKLAAGLVVWLLAGLVLWTQDAGVSGVSRTIGSALSWLGTLFGLGLYWGGGLLVFRTLTTWGFFQPWLRRCGSIERMALVAAAALTLLTLVAHWFASYITTWMIAAAIGLIVLASALGWRLPGKDAGKSKSENEKRQGSQ